MKKTPRLQINQGEQRENQNKSQTATLFIQRLSSGWVPLLIIFIFSFLLYGNTIPHGMTIDDYYVTGEKSDAAGGIDSIPKILTSRYHDFGKKNQFEYRPLVKVSYALEYELFKGNPQVSHFFNVLLFALTGLLVFLLLRRFLRDYPPVFPLLASLLFLAHPIHTEVVNSLKNRDEILSFLFGLLSLRSALRFADTRRWPHILYSVFFLSLAFLGKSSVVVFLAVIPLSLLFFTDLKPRHVLLVFGILVLVLLAYRILPRLYLPPSFRGKEFYENPLMFETDRIKTMATVATILFHYLKISFFPHPMLYYYGYNTIPVVDWSSSIAFVSMVLHIGLLVLGILLAKKKHPVAYGIFFYLAGISVFSNLLQPLMGIVADRFLHGAILGFCIVVAWLLLRAAGMKKSNPGFIHPKPGLLVLLALILLIPYSAKTIVRNEQWADNFSLISRDVKYADRSFIIQKAWANELQRRVKSGDIQPSQAILDSIISVYQRAISIYPYHHDPYKQLGQIYMGLREYEKAIPFFLRTIELSPEKGAYNYYNIGVAYLQTREYEKAIGFLKKGTEILPEAKGYYHLALAYAQSYQPEKGLKACEKGLNLNPGHVSLTLLRGSIYEASGDYYPAISDYTEVLKIEPGNEAARERLLLIYRQLNQPEKAEKLLKSQDLQTGKPIREEEFFEEMTNF